MRAIIAFLAQYASFLSSQIIAHGVRRDVAYAEDIVPLNINAEVFIINVTLPHTQADLSGLMSKFGNVSQKAIVGTRSLSTEFNIATYFYAPSDFPVDGTVELLLHGFDADHVYWDLDPGSTNNYVDVALQAGHAVLAYDRLGVGKSSKPHSLDEVQLATDVAVAGGLIDQLRAGVHGHTFGKIVAIAHSYGSATLTSLLAQRGDIVDAAILTGFSPALEGMAFAPFGLNPQVAALFNPNRFGELDHGYMISGNRWSNLMAFFDYPNFDPEIFDKYLAGRGTETLGELFTLSIATASDYTGPVLVINPDHDLTFCNGNCYQPYNGFSDCNQATLGLFPNKNKGDSYFLQKTGHIINMHHSAAEAYRVKQSWLKKVL